MVDAYPAGTAFLLRAGTYAGQSFRPKSGQQFIGERGGAGERLAVLDGEGRASEAIIANGANGVTVRGLVVRNYAGGDAGKAAINVRFPSAGADWVIEDNEVAYNYSGIYPSTRNLVRGNQVHHNARYGMAGDGTDLVVEGNEIAFNRTDANQPAGDSSATKFVLTTNLMLRGNWVHHNQGHGLWVDINNIYTTYEYNVIEDNWWNGIFHEISYDAWIFHNYFARNGHSTDNPWSQNAVNVTNSPNVEVAYNVLVANRAGIFGNQWNHPGDYGDGYDSFFGHVYGERVLRNFNVHDNDLSQQP